MTAGAERRPLSSVLPWALGPKPWALRVYALGPRSRAALTLPIPRRTTSSVSTVHTAVNASCTLGERLFMPTA